MIVYRVEDVHGKGPYCNTWKCCYEGKDIFKKDLCRDHDDIEHPSPVEDNIILHNKYIFAFASIKSLKNWFDEKWRNILNEAGFFIRVYDVPSDFVKNGSTKKQICFLKEESIFIKTISLQSI
jgi:hypothetical protein